jgi:hypothetical protein
MRFKPTPLTETSLVFSIGWVICLVLSIIVQPNLDKALTMSSGIALVYMLLSYTVWAVAGLLVRRKSHYVRFFVNLTITSVAAVAITGVLLSLIGQASGLSEADAASATSTFVSMGTVYFIGSLIGAILTFFLFTRPKKQK